MHIDDHHHWQLTFVFLISSERTPELETCIETRRRRRLSIIFFPHFPSLRIRRRKKKRGIKIRERKKRVEKKVLIIGLHRQIVLGGVFVERKRKKRG